MNGCVYRTADNQCYKYSDPVRNTMSWCVGNEPCEGRTPSNADRIRGMTDEELAFWMTTNVTCYSCPVDLDACHNFEISGELSCEEILLNWLKAPVVEVQDD